MNYHSVLLREVVLLRSLENYKSINSLQNDLIFIIIASKVVEIYLIELVEFCIWSRLFCWPEGGGGPKGGGPWYTFLDPRNFH